MPRISVYETEAYPVYGIGCEIADDDHESDRYDTRPVTHEFLARYRLVMQMYGMMQDELAEIYHSDPEPRVVVPLNTRPFEELGEWIENEINKHKG